MDKKLTKISGIIAGMEYQNTQKEKKTEQKIVCSAKRRLSRCLFFLIKMSHCFKKMTY